MRIRALLPLLLLLLGGVPVLGGMPAAAGGAPPDMIRIAPGAFTMGAQADDPAASPDEMPAHRVEIAHAFLIARTPVTRAAFARFAAATGYAPAAGCHTLTDDGWREDAAAGWAAPGFAQGDDHPAVCLSRADAQAYAAWLAAGTGIRLRLPSEAEWDFAQQAAHRPFWGTPHDVCRFGNVNDLTAKNKTAKAAEPCTDGFAFTAPVDVFAPGPHGLHGMVGNVWEWTADCAAGDGYASTPRNGRAHAHAPEKDRAHAPAPERDWAPAPDGGCAEGILRGHAWSDAPGPVRPETRLALPPQARSALAGFRLAADAGPDPESR